MDHPYIYTGCFVAPPEFARLLEHISGPRLRRVIACPHATFSYEPERVDETLFGEPVTIRVLGYGCDGENEGVRVELTADHAALRRMIGGIEVPHITISVSEGGRAVNTKGLAFQPVAPLELRGRFGGFARGRGPVTRRIGP